MNIKSLTNLTRSLHILVATLAVWFQDRIHAIFKQLNAGNYYLFGVIILALIGMFIADYAAAEAINKMRWLRRLIARQNDIEGDWVSVVVDTAQPTEVVAAEYSRIRYCNGQYILSGDTWTLDGQWMGDFCTGGTSYKERQLEYYYKTGVNRLGGFGIMLFTPQDSLPTACVCRYIDFGLTNPRATLSRIISRKLRKISLDDRQAAALEFAGEVKRKGSLHRAAFL